MPVRSSTCLRLLQARRCGTHASVMMQPRRTTERSSPQSAREATPASVTSRRPPRLKVWSWGEFLASEARPSLVIKWQPVTSSSRRPLSCAARVLTPASVTFAAQETLTMRSWPQFCARATSEASVSRGQRVKSTARKRRQRCASCCTCSSVTLLQTAISSERSPGQCCARALRQLPETLMKVRFTRWSAGHFAARAATPASVTLVHWPRLTPRSSGQRPARASRPSFVTAEQPSRQMKRTCVAFSANSFSRASLTFSHSERSTWLTAGSVNASRSSSFPLNARYCAASGAAPSSLASASPSATAFDSSGACSLDSTCPPSSSLSASLGSSAL
mmetsp:Transcript_92033/g.297900  ORF Transcript_92033/g.297900 Transcript_92033/m.297900 type:complete len:333 (-) Transcript_92033:1076-2074(-)